MSDDDIREYYRPPSEQELARPLSRFAAARDAGPEAESLDLGGLSAGAGRLGSLRLEETEQEPELAGSAA